MFLIVGLGNPGKKYINTRHNLGHRALDWTYKEWGQKYQFSKWKNTSKQKSHISEGQIEDKEVVLAKSSVFMNHSGAAVKKLIQTYNIDLRSLFIIHDDVDIPLGKIKISQNRGTAGHKGVQSVINHLGTKSFTRFRIGICPSSKERVKTSKSTEKFVLQKFSQKENKIVKDTLQIIPDLLEQSIIEGVKKAQSSLGNVFQK